MIPLFRYSNIYSYNVINVYKHEFYFSNKFTTQQNFRGGDNFASLVRTQVRKHQQTPPPRRYLGYTGLTIPKINLDRSIDPSTLRFGICGARAAVATLRFPHPFAQRRLAASIAVAQVQQKRVRGPAAGEWVGPCQIHVRGQGAAAFVVAKESHLYI